MRKEFAVFLKDTVWTCLSCLYHMLYVADPPSVYILKPAWFPIVWFNRTLSCLCHMLLQILDHVNVTAAPFTVSYLRNLRPVHSEEKRRRKLSFDFCHLFFYIFFCSLIFFTFAIAFVGCEYALTWVTKHTVDIIQHYWKHMCRIFMEHWRQIETELTWSWEKITEKSDQVFPFFDT